MKILVITNISLFQFYRYIGEISTDILIKIDNIKIHKNYENIKKKSK